MMSSVQLFPVVCLKSSQRYIKPDKYSTLLLAGLHEDADIWPFACTIPLFLDKEHGNKYDKSKCIDMKNTTYFAARFKYIIYDLFNCVENK